MEKPDVKKLESDLRNAKIDPAGLRWADPREKPFEVLGFYWFKSEKRFRRFPAKASSRAVNGTRSVYFEDVTPLMTDMLDPLEMPLFHSIPETRSGIWRI